MRSSQTAINLQGVTKRFGKFKAVESINIRVPTGQVVGFVGANGAGKTTTISMMLGFLGSSEGIIELFESVVTPSNAHKSHQQIGYAAGDMELPGQLTGGQYLTFLRSQRKGCSDEQYEQLIKRFSPQLTKKIHTLSRGNKQKIALVAAFLGEPDLIVLDEPTSGLDPVMQETFLSLVREYREKGKTVFMPSHYLQEVMEVCDRVILMSNGKVVEDVLTSELLKMGGKQLRVQTTYKATKPPKGAESIEVSELDGDLVLEFVYKGDMGELQRWLAAVKQLKDIEVSEYNLEESFKSLYQTEEGA